MPQMVKLQSTLAEIMNPSFDVSAPLTPDALMIYCQTRLRGLDEQVNVAFHKQQIANHDASVLSNLASNLWTPNQPVNTACNGGLEAALGEAKKMLEAAKGITDPVTRKALEDKASQLLDKCQAGIDARYYGNKMGFEPPKAIDLLAKLDEGGGGNAAIDTILDTKCGAQGTYDVSIGDFKASTTEAVQGIQKDLNASTELSMINLQSLVSQRQSSVQMITNMVQSLGDQMNKIAANIGH